MMAGIELYCTTLAIKHNYNLNALKNSVRFYHKYNGKVVELSNEYLTECKLKGIEPKELIIPINPENDAC